MFTGLIEELGTVERIRSKGASIHLTIKVSTVLGDMKTGDSITLDGACLTVINVTPDSFSVDVMAETLKRTTLSRFKVGDRVNLERALKGSDRLGGHLVTGHIDGIGRVRERKAQGDDFMLRISAPSEIIKYIIPKGSVAVDGVSLTVVEVARDSFTVAVIPYTAKMTTLGRKGAGSLVNLESDLLGKYVDRLMNYKERKISRNFLAEHGFT
ncbi:riboflavin synthase [candidate division NPL-UPA2 bacterium]|nr:riboflavin synthase [candidate division NPL-UPA2 bacterium]